MARSNHDAARKTSKFFNSLLGLGIERDLYFQADKPISAYSDEAFTLGRINA